MTPALLLAVAAGGLLGAPARYLLDRAITRRIESDLPWGTQLVNATGTFLLGVLTGLVVHARLSAVPAALLGTGFCGAYTTFSAFSFETARLLGDGRLAEALGNVAIGIATGVAAAAAGLAIGLAL